MERECWHRQIAERYAHVLRALYAVAGQRERAEDALHDALLDALAPGVIERIGRADAWLYAVAVRKLRRSAWRTRLEILAPFVAAPYPAPDLARIEALEMLRALTPRQREVIVARYYLDLSFKEIAAHLGITVGAATSTASQALAKLRVTARESE